MKNNWIVALVAILLVTSCAHQGSAQNVVDLWGCRYSKKTELIVAVECHTRKLNGLPDWRENEDPELAMKRDFLNMVLQAEVKEAMDWAADNLETAAEKEPSKNSSTRPIWEHSQHNSKGGKVAHYLKVSDEAFAALRRNTISARAEAEIRRVFDRYRRARSVFEKRSE